MRRDVSPVSPVRGGIPWPRLVLSALILVSLVSMVSGCIRGDTDDDSPTPLSDTAIIATQVATYIPTLTSPPATRPPATRHPVPTPMLTAVSTPTPRPPATRPPATRRPAPTPTPTSRERDEMRRDIRLQQQEYETKAEYVATLIIGFLADGIIDEEEKPIFCAGVPGWKDDLTEAQDYVKEYGQISSQMVTLPITLQEYRQGLQEYLELLAEVAEIYCK